MTGDPRLPELFALASELQGAAREAWLLDLGREDGALARDIERLLAASPAGERWFAGPAWERWPTGGAEATAPERIGPFRIDREIGRGGMGRVFLAEQEGTEFRRTVALKVIDQPAAVDDMLRRFRAEVRILAGLEHPGIARFYDAGRADDGTLYLALEYVEGEDLLTFVRSRNLDIRRRLEIFLQVLEAVEYAHRHLVVHRDLKPGNVLVHADGRARLLDFGVSKMLDADAADLATRTDLRAFTPAYASPEQFRGEPVTAASDVYSLGVILYELLAGVRPFAATGSWAALERAVLDSDPDPPSSAARRLTTPTSARGGQKDPTTGSPARRLGRDLDAICLKALRKEPGRRYASAAAFADDLQRYLQGRPVHARQGGLRYRAGKLLRRSRGRLATAAAMGLAVAALLFAVQAQRHAERGAQALEPPPPRPFPFSPSTLASVDDAKLRFDAQPASLEAGAELALALNHAGRDPEAAVIVTRLRQIPGKAEDPLIDYVEASVATGRDEPQRALILHNRALERAVAGGRGELVAQIRATRGRLLTTLGRNAEARADMKAARADFLRAGDQASLARVSNDLAIEVLQHGELAEGERLLEAALVATRAASKENRGATMLSNLALVHAARGRADLAERTMHEALQIRRELGRTVPTANTLTGLGDILQELGRPREAAPLYDEAIGLLRGVNATGELGFALFGQATLALDRGELGGFEATAAEIERGAQAAGSTDGLAYAELLLGRGEAARGELQAARAHLGEAQRLFVETGHPDLAAAAMLDLADAEIAAGHPAAAQRVVDGALQTCGQRHPSFLTLRGELLLAESTAAQGRIDQARRHLDTAGPRTEAQPSVVLRLQFLRARARLLRSEGRDLDARRDLESALALATASERKIEEQRLRGALSATRPSPP